MELTYLTSVPLVVMKHTLTQVGHLLVNLFGTAVYRQEQTVEKWDGVLTLVLLVLLSGGSLRVIVIVFTNKQEQLLLH
tara:strand:+ start:332 stop:565 length:234 start_codon:yes stop_codon:yes gene_type:complete